MRSLCCTGDSIVKKEPDVLELKAQYQFWRDRYEQTKSVKDLINMQNHLQQYLQLVNEQKADKNFLLDGEKNLFKKQREAAVKRQISQVSPRIATSFKIVEEYMKNSVGQQRGIEIANQCNVPYSDTLVSLNKLQSRGIVKKTKLKGIRNQPVFWERCDD